MCDLAELCDELVVSDEPPINIAAAAARIFTCDNGTWIIPTPATWCDKWTHCQGYDNNSAILCDGGQRQEPPPAGLRIPFQWDGRLRNFTVVHDPVHYLQTSESPYLTHLTISHTSTAAPASMALYLALVYLDMSYNRLTSVDSSTFPLFPTLRHLDLRGNTLFLYPISFTPSLTYCGRVGDDPPELYIDGYAQGTHARDCAVATLPTMPVPCFRTYCPSDWRPKAKCPGSTVEIEARFLCDGIIDCVNGTDEAAGICNGYYMRLTADAPANPAGCDLIKSCFSPFVHMSMRASILIIRMQCRSRPYTTALQRHDGRFTTYTRFGAEAFRTTITFDPAQIYASVDLTGTDDGLKIQCAYTLTVSSFISTTSTTSSTTSTTVSMAHSDSTTSGDSAAQPAPAQKKSAALSDNAVIGICSGILLAVALCGFLIVLARGKHAFRIRTLDSLAPASTVSASCQMEVGTSF